MQSLRHLRLEGCRIDGHLGGDALGRLANRCPFLEVLWVGRVRRDRGIMMTEVEDLTPVGAGHDGRHQGPPTAGAGTPQGAELVWNHLGEDGLLALCVQLLRETPEATKGGGQGHHGP